MKHTVLFIFSLFILAGCSSNVVTPSTEIPPASNLEESQILFDDFSYSRLDEMTSHGWIVRSGSGWPGVSGATFRAENVSFVDDIIHRWYS
jgi:hypothetical protein